MRMVNALPSPDGHVDVLTEEFVNFQIGGFERSVAHFTALEIKLKKRIDSGESDLDEEYQSVYHNLTTCKEKLAYYQNVKLSF